MLLVNNISLGAQTPKQLLHADWQPGVHLADFVFPWFLFIVGVAVPYSQASARRKHLPTLQYDLKALWRAATLVFLGCVIDSFIVRRPTFGLGVLQLIGVAYFAAVLVGGLFSLRGRLVMAAGLLAAHWAVLKLVPVPGVGAGVFTEASNVPAWLNQTYLQPYHLKGLLSVVPTTAMVLIGTAVGDLLRRKKITPLAKGGVLAVCGAGLACVGWIGSHPAIGDWFLPMNKPCWTAPYILFTAGWACIGLAAMYLIVDTTPGKWGQWLAFPLIVTGMNAIVAYTAPVLTKVALLRNISTTWPTGQPTDLENGIRQWFYGEWGRINGGCAYTLAYIAVWWCVLWFLYKRRLFLRV
jgi:predicted acyltransferase